MAGNAHAPVAARGEMAPKIQRIQAVVGARCLDRLSTGRVQRRLCLRLKALHLRPSSSTLLVSATIVVLGVSVSNFMGRHHA